MTFNDSEWNLINFESILPFSNEKFKHFTMKSQSIFPNPFDCIILNVIYFKYHPYLNDFQWISHLERIWNQLWLKLN